MHNDSGKPVSPNDPHDLYSVVRKPPQVLPPLQQEDGDYGRLRYHRAMSSAAADTYDRLGRSFFFCVQCDDRAKSSGRWLLGSPPSAVVRQLAPRAWCPLQCLLAKTVGVLSPGVGRSEECAQGFAPQSHIHSGLNQQDLVSLDVFLAHSDQYADGRWWFGSSCQGC